MSYRVLVSQRAKQMLGAHLKFLKNVSWEGAKVTQKKLLQAIRSLEELPTRCPFLSDSHLPPNKYHKLLVESHYLILYQIQDNTVYVDYILDCRQDYTWLLP